ECVLLVEKLSNPQEYTDPLVQNWCTAHPSVYSGKIGPGGDLKNVAQPKADWTRFGVRHNHGGHLLFADGHVEFFQWPDVQYRHAQITPLYNYNFPDANQYGKIRWSALGPVNSN